MSDITLTRHAGRGVALTVPFVEAGLDTSKDALATLTCELSWDQVRQLVATASTLMLEEMGELSAHLQRWVAAG